jgi:hypothetical protein
MASKTSSRAGGGKPAAKGGRRPTGKPVPIKQPRPWGMIALGTAVALIAVGIIGSTWWMARDAGEPYGSRAAQQIDGMQNFRDDGDELARGHKPGKQTYKTSPPVYGDHNVRWQNCEGNVYDKPIANEHAVHSLEHGAVWITYKPGLAKADIDKLASKVQGKQYLMLSPYEGLDKPISLQAWGLQLKVDKASDERIDKFIANFRQSATVEDGATCSNGLTATGTEPQEAAAPPAGGGS